MEKTMGLSCFGKRDRKCGMAKDGCGARSNQLKGVS